MTAPPHPSAFIPVLLCSSSRASDAAPGTPELRSERTVDPLPGSFSRRCRKRASLDPSSEPRALRAAHGHTRIGLQAIPAFSRIGDISGPYSCSFTSVGERLLALYIGWPLNFFACPVMDR